MKITSPRTILGITRACRSLLFRETAPVSPNYSSKQSEYQREERSSACRFVQFLCFFLVLLGATVSLAAEPTGQRPPNIVFLFADDMGYGDLACYGNKINKTPHLDKLAAEGMRLTDFCMASSVCTPSRSAVQTGRYPQRNGLYYQIRNNRINHGYRYTEETYKYSPEMTLGMDLREITMAQMLKQGNYATGMIGKWDGGRARRWLPLQRGYDFFYGFANTGIDYWTHERYGIASMFRGNTRIKEEGYATDLFTREAIRFIRQNKDRPFFLYAAYNAPHGPSNLERTGMQAPKEYIDMYPDLDPKENKTRYRACISNLDDNIGKIMAALRELGLEKDTFVIFTSDHGAPKTGDNLPMRGKKGQFYEGGVRVPCIVRWPGHVKANSTSGEFHSSLDLVPTFLDLADEAAPDDLKLDGYSMLPVLTDGEKSPRQEMFWQLLNEKAARIGSYKWLEFPSGKEELFNLSKDPYETHNLTEEKPEVLQRVKARWAAWRKEMDESEPRGPFRDY